MTCRSCPENMSVAASVPLLILRVGLGGVFLVAAYFKLFQSAFSGSGHPEFSPQSFMEAIQAFKIIGDDRLLLLATFWVPWTELVCGVALVLGLWTRAASLILGLLLAVFIALIASSILRNMGSIKCGCFGNYKLFCEGTVNWCKVGENSVLLLVAMTLNVCGGGLLGLDGLLRRSPKPAKKDA
jgi:uncharacterized membrane protein YphA (DoxX/SURF4 family)